MYLQASLGIIKLKSVLKYFQQAFMFYDGGGSSNRCHYKEYSGCCWEGLQCFSTIYYRELGKDGTGFGTTVLPVQQASNNTC